MADARRAMRSGQPNALPESQQLTIEEFLAFTGTRPDEERWELIEGMAVLSPSPTDFHQIICTNISGLLFVRQSRGDVRWIPLLGIGTRVPASPRSLPQPDVMVKEAAALGRPDTAEALVLFEVLSGSNTKADQAWRKRVYASIPNLQHYVTVAQRKAHVVRFDRSAGWRPVLLASMADVLELPAIDAALPLAEIYRNTAVAAPRRRGRKG